MTIGRMEKLEIVGFTFIVDHLKGPTLWYQRFEERFEELVNYKKFNGYTNVPQRCRPLGPWVNAQQIQYRLLNEKKDPSLISDRYETLKSIGLEFKCQPIYSSWDQRSQELVEFKKVNGHSNAPTNSGVLAYWVTNQRMQNRFLKEAKD